MLVVLEPLPTKENTFQTRNKKPGAMACGKLNWAFINSTAGINEASVTNLSHHDRGGDSSWPD